MKQLYHGYDEVVSIFKALEVKRPMMFKTSVIGQTWEQRDIILLTVSRDISVADTKPALFYTGTIHAREWIGLELAVGFAQYIDKSIDYDAWLQELLEKSTLYLVACANPDGFEYSRNHFSFWRKNRRQNADGSYGVDLNRNFSIGWVKNNNPTSNIYGGPEPFSEPETQTLKNFVDTHDNITIALDYHSQGNVFFPAHNFKHEDTIDTTDMNVLCANMCESIRKVSDREYGIHQGKPPANLISGSGREYYYSKGALASVVEVGTRNISDFMDDMSEHIAEHISALMVALNEVPNYYTKKAMDRVENFRAVDITQSSVQLQWDYPNQTKDTYFEIYRSTKEKSYCRHFNLFDITQANFIESSNLKSDTRYFYHVRAVCKSTRKKSPYAPVVEIRTHVAPNEFHRTYYSLATGTGYVAEKYKDNSKHFGVNSMFVGVNENKGISYGVLNFALKTIPKKAKIKSAKVSLYPMNRVSVTIEKYGEWDLAIISPNKLDDFESIHTADISSYVGRPTASHQLSQGIWREWDFSLQECEKLEEAINDNEVTFRLEGPKELQVGRNSQMMQWDIGYGKFGYGLDFRPKLEITYTMESDAISLFAEKTFTVCSKNVNQERLSCGFDKEGKKVFSSFEFNLSSLPSWEYTEVTRAYLELNPTSIYAKDNIRFHLEMIEQGIDQNYQAIQDRNIIENIGYDVSTSELKTEGKQHYVFDTYSIEALQENVKNNTNIAFLLRPSVSKRGVKNSMVDWHSSDPTYAPKLIIEYLHKRKHALAGVSNLTYSIENGKIKLSWTNPKHDDFRGVVVVRNVFRIPISPYDGDKLFGGIDTYTYDDFGDINITKYYSVFTYDDVPNYSQPVSLSYKEHL